ncbi:hypothetical protein [Bradyrhizobium canariense]|uniref:ATP dependent DNA ligase n=1 Tax=Bradyrhizobium canariense TaxID=255045 RepID=UPI001FCE1745|nr:hypothetical protein [Bradyrhizobium canariense]
MKKAKRRDGWEPNQIDGDPRGARYRRQPEAKAQKPVKKPKATWVEPKFYADIEYRDITSEGLLRASSFKELSKGTRRS